MSHAHDDRCSHPPIGDAIAKCRADVDRAGWHCMGVFDDPESGSPPFAYTVGLTATFGHPELAVAGLEPRQGHSLLDSAVALIREGLRIGDGDVVQKVISGYPARFRALDLGACSLSFGMSDVYYGHPVPRLQMLWPDPAGLFPGEQGCDRRMWLLQVTGGWS